MKLTSKIIGDIKKDPKVLKNFSENDIADIIEEANNSYYNKNESIFSDAMYDIIIEILKSKNENHPLLHSVGAPINERLKVALPYWMGSLDKIKPDEKAINNWIKKYPGSYVLSDKIDGISGLLHIRSGVYKLFTRGDGANGMDISKMIPYISNIPKKIDKDLSVRGEIVISLKNWDKIKHLGANPRNFVSGLFNSKRIQKDLLKYVDFIGYQLMYPEKMQIASQFREMAKYNFAIADAVTKDKIDAEILSEYYSDRRENSNYEIDGIVVYHNGVYNNNQSGNPKFGFAFKNIITAEEAEVTVLDIEWNISKHGLIKPVVIFSSVLLDGSNVSRATAFNAKYINDNKVGPGSKLIIIKAGMIIPFIKKVLSISETGHPKMPEIDYTWNETGVDIEIDEEVQSDEFDKKIITNFFTKFKVTGVSTGIVSKLYDAGFNSIYKILHITVDELLTVDGIQGRSAQNIYEAINAIDLTDYLTLMVASNTFGRGLGERKLKLIIDVYPNVINDTPTLSDIIKINGFSNITATQFLENLEKFKEFLAINKLNCGRIVNKKHKIQTNIEQNLKDISVLFTGFRDIDMEGKIISRGGTIKTTLTNKVNILIIKDSTVENKKTETARSLKVVILTKDNFINEYL
jgi:DNA ligase (NAD+)